MGNRYGNAKVSAYPLCVSCQEEEAKVDKLQWKIIRLKRVVKLFKNNNEEYLKIKKQLNKKLLVFY